MTAFAYIMHEDRPIGVPSEHYMRTCLEGYLVICHLDGETDSEMADTGELGDLYGYSDCTDVRDIRVFRIADAGAPIELDIEPIFSDTAIALLGREIGEVLDECQQSRRTLFFVDGAIKRWSNCSDTRMIETVTK